MRPSVVCALLALALAVPTGAAPDPKKPGPINDSAQIAERLLDRIDIDQRLETMPFKEALDYLRERTGLTILIDMRAMRAKGEGAEQQIEEMNVKVPVMKNVRIETVLAHILDQVDADFIIAQDHVRVTTHQMKDLQAGQARRLPDLYSTFGAEEAPEAERSDLVRTAGHVTVAFKEVPAADALKEIASRAGRTVVVSGPAAEKSKTLVTLNLANVPFETAAAGLAEAAGLRAFRTGSVVVVVTPERAKQAEAPGGGLPGVGIGGLGQSTLSLEDLESIARIFAGKAGDADGVRRELQKLREDRATVDAERQKLVEQVQKLTAEIEKMKKK